MSTPNARTPRTPFSDCLACEHYLCEPRELAVDRTGTSPDEADGLCGVHRGRLTEGACVLCGRRMPWVMLQEQSDIGACRPCFEACFGEGEARRIEAAWAELDRALNL